MKVCASFLLQFVSQGEAMGYSRDLVLQQLDIDRSLLYEPWARIPFDTYLTCIQRLIAFTGEPNLGLFAGQHIHPSLMGPLTALMLNCTTLLEAYQTYLAHERLVNEARCSDLKLENGNAYNSIAYPGYDDVTIAPVIERDFASLLYYTRFLTFESVSFDRCVRKLTFRHSPLGSLSAYEKVFPVPVEFGQEANLIVVSSEAFELPIPGANRSALNRAAEEMQLFARKLSSDVSFADQVKDYLIVEGEGRLLGSEEVAARFAMSASTFHRKLKQAGATYRDLAEEVRKEKSIMLIREGALSMEEIAARLGFSGKPAFFKAFKRWFGQPPSSYRNL